MAELIIVGGGLAGSLLAYRLAMQRPEIALRLIERGDRLGGNHSWSFHETDVSPEALAWLDPLIAYRWDGHDVMFPAYSRRLAGRYFTITSDSLHAAVAAHLGERVRFGVDCMIVSPHAVTLGGQDVAASLVIDARGDAASPHRALAYQKFVGLEVECTAPHGVDVPLLMDAAVAQEDGFRFVYVLPFDSRRLLIEDTRYSASPDIAMPAFRTAIAAYAERRGWTFARVLREEVGVLPITLDADHRAFWQEPARTTAPAIGMRAGLCHPTTGYSLPDAVRLADLLTALPTLTLETAAATIRRYADRQWRAQRFYRLLNRLLFLAAAPERRYRVLERFYRLPEPLVARFYAGETTLPDMLRILTGKPPVPLGAAFAALSPRAAWPR